MPGSLQDPYNQGAPDSGDLFGGTPQSQYGSSQDAITKYQAWNSNSGGAPGQYGGAPGGAQHVADMYGDLATQTRNRDGITANLADAYNDRGQGQTALGYLQDAAAGTGPSAATGLMAQGVNNSVAAQMGMAAAARGGGGNVALAQRNAATTGANMQMQGTNQAAIIRAQEMAQARQQYAQAALQAQGLDADTAFKQAQLLAAQQEANDRASLGYSGLASQTMEAQLAADSGAFAQNSDSQRQREKLKQDREDRVISGISQMGSSMMMMSDATLKTDIAAGGKDVDDFARSLSPYSYAYKEKRHEPSSEKSGGRYLGIIAQNVERTETGKRIVRDTPEGKAIEIAPMVSALAATAGRQQQRIDELETLLSKGRRAS